MTGTTCQVVCQAPVATSFSELLPEWASAGSVSMLAGGATEKHVNQTVACARQVGEPLHRWAVWADATEQERLRAYHARSIGDEMRRRWQPTASTPAAEADNIGRVHDEKGRR